jgi:large conductance mechanosensitive channel
MLKEFKTFIMRGNVLDLAVAVIIGGAFGKIITSLVNDVIMPPIGLLLGKVDFSNLYLNLSGTPYNSLAEAPAAGAPPLNYGLFLNNVVDFLSVGLVMFLAIRAVHRFSKKEEKTRRGYHTRMSLLYDRHFQKSRALSELHIRGKTFISSNQRQVRLLRDLSTRGAPPR